MASWASTNERRLHSGDRKLLLFIAAGVEARGYPPTAREIAAFMDWRSSSSARNALTRLSQHGYVEWNPGEVRTLRLTGKGWEAVKGEA